MKKATPLMLTGCLLAGMGYACTRGAFRNTTTETNQRQSTAALEAQDGGGIAEADADAGDDAGDDAGVTPPVTSDCGASGCGSNDSWLGENVTFRTLHLSPGKENEAHLSILEFRDREGNPLTIDVQGDLLMGISQRKHKVLTGADLAGAQLLLGHPGDKAARKKATYVITIEKVHDADFWAKCQDCNDADNRFPVYELSVSGNNGPKTRLCAPAPGDQEHRVINMYGEAVIFRGDFYDERTHRVSTSVTPENADLFNIACFGSAFSKLHFLRHTSASQVDPGNPQNPTVEDRQALLRLLTADYCGNGSSFTEDGMPLKLAFKSQIYTLWDGAKYSMNDAGSLEALWTPDGAMCIGTPRLLRSSNPRWHDLTVDRIRQMCQTIGKKTDSPSPALKDCSKMKVDLHAGWFANGNYAISGNPK